MIEFGSGAAHQHVAAGPAIDDVVATAAGEHVDAAAAEENVRRVVGEDRVVELVAGAVERARRHHQDLEARPQDEADGARHDVCPGPGARALRQDHVAEEIDDGEIVAEPSVHGVGAGAAVEEVVARSADQAVVVAGAGERIVAVAAIQRVGAVIADHQVVERVAGAADVAGAGENHGLDVRRQGPEPGPASSMTTSPGPPTM